MTLWFTFLTISCLVVPVLCLLRLLDVTCTCIAGDGAVSEGGGDVGPGLGSNNRCRLNLKSNSITFASMIIILYIPAWIKLPNLIM